MSDHGGKTVNRRNLRENGNDWAGTDGDEYG
jgi:hypothetical protein